MSEFLQRLSEDEFRYEYLSPSEMLGRLQHKAILYQPLGSLEWHNEHLPLGTDTLCAIAMASRLCRKLGGVMAPACFFNTGGCHRHATTFYMPTDPYREMIRQVIRGYQDIPAKLIVLVNGHGGTEQKDTPQMVAEELNGEDHPWRVCAADAYLLGADSEVRIDHADTGETSWAMEVIPQLVRMDRDIQPDLFSGKLPFQVKGPPSPEKGRILYGHFLRESVDFIERESTAALE